MRTYIVFWFYQANHGWEHVKAVFASEAIANSTYGHRKDITKMATPLSEITHAHTTNNFHFGKNKLM